MRLSAIWILAFAFIFTISARSEDATQRAVDRIFAAFDKPSSPGCALGVIQNGHFIYRKGYGMGSLELAVPLSDSSIFYMGSVSKQFTAASVVLAAEQGSLSLDDDIRKYIPELPGYGHVITLRQMLHHTSGLRDFETLLVIAGRHPGDLHSKDEMIDLIAHQKSLNNLPGDEFVYSNTNYFLAGEAVARATKKSLAEFAAENIFRPLGMAHTRFYDDHTFVVPGRIPAYGAGANGDFLVDWSTNFDIVGPGGLMSSVDDLLPWDQNFYANKLGKGTLLKELQTQGVLNNGKRISYALGLEIGSYRGLPTVEHGGALFGYRTEILRFPGQDFTVLCLCNFSNAGPGNLSRRVADLYLEHDLKTEASTSTPSGDSGFPDPTPFAGKYFDPRTHSLYSFTVSGGRLIGWGAALPRVSRNQFMDLGQGIITFDEFAGAMKATLEMNGEVIFAGNRIQEPNLSSDVLASYAGRYQSTELDSTYNLSLDHGNLMLRVNWDKPQKLTPIAPDEFDTDDFGTIEFRRKNGRPIQLAVFAGNARNVVFEKAN